MRREIFIVVACCYLVSASAGHALVDPCGLQERSLQKAENETYRLQRKVASNQSRVARTIEWRESQILRLDQRGAYYQGRIELAVMEAEERLEYFRHSPQNWGCFNVCARYFNLRRSIERRIYNAQMRYNRWANERIYVIARYDAKVQRMLTNLALAEQAYNDAAARYEAARADLATCRAPRN